MTDLQKLQLRASEIRSRLNSLNALPEMDDDQAREMDALTREYQDVERRSRAAMIAEQDAATDAASRFDAREDGEAAEVRALRGRVSIRDYLDAAHGAIQPQGAAAELNAALEVRSMASDGSVCVPWTLLEVRSTETETRADVSTTTSALGQVSKRVSTTTSALDGPVSQRPILQRLFGSKNALDVLGVRFDEVPAGQTEWRC